MPDDSQRAQDVLAAEEFAVPAPDPGLSARAAHDVLAAEEFGMGSSDPDLRGRAARDVLAAEEFGVPAPDPVLAISTATIPLPHAPGDPADREPPREVLAAESFGVPGSAPRALPPDYGDGRASGPRRPRLGAVMLVVALGVGARRRRRRRGAASPRQSAGEDGTRPSAG